MTSGPPPLPPHTKYNCFNIWDLNFKSSDQVVSLFDMYTAKEERIVRWSKGDNMHDTPMVCRVGGILCCVCW